MKNQPDLKQQLMQTYQAVRHTTELLCQPLATEDYVIQSIEDVSPPKWHLAHTTWFFETFILLKQMANYKPFDPNFQYLFNSYYHGVGEPFPRVKRGLLSRPTVKTVYAYRSQIDKLMLDLINQASAETLAQLRSLIVLGHHHEQQHQELLLMDIKYNFSMDPNFPSYHTKTIHSQNHSATKLEFIPISASGVVSIGYQGNEFCFDNELPQHQQILQPYALGSRLITNAEYCEFIAAGGYQKSNYWLSDGWDAVQKNQWNAPLYWNKIGNKWYVFTLSGLKELDPNEPVSHVSYYEADAYAKWCDKRLPTEFEWENYVANKAMDLSKSNFLETHIYHPQPASTQEQQFYGDLWEWTRSAYSPYPGYKPITGALGEYNGKFMNNQMVLRGGSSITPQSHIRASYRNFFQPDKRWQFSGIRLATDL